MTTYDKLLAIASSKMGSGYLRGYETDLTTHDRMTLLGAVEGAQYVWLLREHGTELFPIASGLNPVWATYWLDAGDSARVPTLAFHVTVGAGDREVMAISPERARRLASVPHPQGLVRGFSLFGDRVQTA